MFSLDSYKMYIVCVGVHNAGHLTILISMMYDDILGIRQDCQIDILYVFLINIYI